MQSKYVEAKKLAEKELKRLLEEGRLVEFIAFVENSGRTSGFFIGVAVTVVAMSIGIWLGSN